MELKRREDKNSCQHAAAGMCVCSLDMAVTRSRWKKNSITTAGAASAAAATSHSIMRRPALQVARENHRQSTQCILCTPQSPFDHASSYIVDWKTLTRTSNTYEVRNEIGRLNTCEVRNEIGRLNTWEVRNEIGRPGSVMVVLEIVPEPAELQSLACSALKLVRTGKGQLRFAMEVHD